MTEGYSVLLLDDDNDLRPILSELISSYCDCRILALPSFKSMTSNPQQVLETRIAFLDVNLGTGQPSGIDAYEWLRANHYAGRILFLTGHARSHPAVSRALELGRANVLTKPVPADRLISDVRLAIG